MKTNKQPVRREGSDSLVVSEKHTDKIQAVLTGIFFILVTGFAISGLKFNPILINQESLMQGTAYSALVVLGTAIELMLVCLAGGIASLLYPYLRIFKERFGLTYFCFLVMEALFMLGMNTLIYSYVFFKSEVIPRKMAFA
ncbi:hypothetical protein GCM10028803_58200 [Larkinella knui]|uniref:DUF4386 domain-containing protein n=1 Tax=Larkinella knui TaxID=2025310 RepID=A0A3P1CHJ9_9BACT|nr:hypothetical protein [Larkinella knui]RRB12747.1 hypothetical protein EHT87_21445 [Larkinella knui]